MRYAIIAAGEGSRLKQEGVQTDKPLVRLCGEMMLDRLIEIFARQGASEVVAIVNDTMSAVKRNVEELVEERAGGACPLHALARATPSSMHSLFEISPLLAGEPFCLTTVDTVFREKEFGAYVRAFAESEDDGLMAVTDHIDDEKPLYVGTDSDLNITGFHDTQHGCHYISGGIYCLKPKALDTLRRCVNEGQSRMRNFQRQMVADGLRLKAYPFSNILDVDHADDIRKAEAFLKQ